MIRAGVKRGSSWQSRAATPATDGLAITLPDDVVDLRLADGKITLYKRTP